MCARMKVCVRAHRIRLPSGGLLSHVPLAADIRGFALRAVACVHERDNAICTRRRTRAACSAAGVASAAPPLKPNPSASPVGWSMGLWGAGTFAELVDVPAKRLLREADACQRSASDGIASDWGAPRHMHRWTAAAEERRGHTGSGRRTAAAIMGSPGPFGGGRVLDKPVTARKCEGERAPTHKSERTEGVGRRADRVRRTCRGRRSGSLRAEKTLDRSAVGGGRGRCRRTLPCRPRPLRSRLSWPRRLKNPNHRVVRARAPSQARRTKGAQRGRGACTPTVGPLAAADVALGASSPVDCCAHSRDGAVWHISSDARS